MSFMNDGYAEFQHSEAELEAFRNMSDAEIVAMFRRQRDEPETRDFHYFRDDRHMCATDAGEQFLAWERANKIRHAKAARRQGGLQ